MSVLAAQPTLSSWVGRSETTRDIASRANTIGLGALLNAPLDPDTADAATLFPLGHWLQFTPTAPMNELGHDGHPRLGGFMPPIRLPRRMWAGSDITFRSPITVGEQLTRTTTIDAVVPKKGSSGPLCFVKLRHEVQSSDELALVEHQTLVYREAAEASPLATRRAPRPDGPRPEGWDWVRPARSDEVALFRYSALTFNSHRIHYDLQYATREEGYPGLVVHGPLSATLLLNALLQEMPGFEVARFEFSARAPVFANETVHLCGRIAAPSPDTPQDGDGRRVELAVVAPGGAIAVAARAELR